MKFTIRAASLEDQGALKPLIAASVSALSREEYTEQQIELSIKTVFGIDLELIEDQTYFVVETEEGRIAGCGGWSKRKTLYGASQYTQSRNPQFLDPKIDAAKIRAFFVHPDFARQGVGTLLLDKCENEAKAQGFRTVEMMATLPGVKLYSVRGYEMHEEVKVPLDDTMHILCIRMTKKL